jgi:transposase
MPARQAGVELAPSDSMTQALHSLGRTTQGVRRVTAPLTRVSERGNAGLFAAQDQRMDVMRAFIGIDHFQVKTQAINQLRSILVSAPQDIRERLWKAKAEHCVAGCAHLRNPGSTTLLQTLTTTLRLLAKRWLMLAAELKELDAALERLTSDSAPHLRAQFGVGPQTAAALIAAAGDTPERLRSEAALAALCGVNPLPASSGKTLRHRLNRGGDREANNPLWTIAMVRMRSEPRTRAYVERRTAEGLSNKEIHRCLKRYIVRELYPLILADLTTAAGVS